MYFEFLFHCIKIKKKRKWKIQNILLNFIELIFLANFFIANRETFTSWLLFYLLQIFISQARILISNFAARSLQSFSSSRVSCTRLFSPFFYRRQLTMHRVWKVATKDSGGYTESNLLEDHNTPCNRAPLFERNRDPSKLDERHVSSSSYRRWRNFNNGIPDL